jgi:hypothetical protein
MENKYYVYILKSGLVRLGRRITAPRLRLLKKTGKTYSMMYVPPKGTTLIY